MEKRFPDYFMYNGSFYQFSGVFLALLFGKINVLRLCIVLFFSNFYLIGKYSKFSLILRSARMYT